MDTMAKKHYSYLPIKLLLKYHFNNYEKIQNITAPILVIHSKNDEMTDFQE
jgi:dipeptidyl aminopeptidase/acylaminoacyl peptidase